MLAHPRSARLAQTCQPETRCSRVSLSSCFILQHPAARVGAGMPVPKAATLLGLSASCCSPGGLEVSSEKAARERLELAPQPPPAPCARALVLQAFQPSDCLPLSSPARFDVGRGLPGAPGIGWQSRLSGAAAVTLRLGLPAGRKRACVEFLFDPHGGINRKRRAPSRALHLPLLWALRSTS